MTYICELYASEYFILVLKPGRRKLLYFVFDQGIIDKLLDVREGLAV